MRSASQAIREFAPDNNFYSQGFKFLISGINTFDWSDKNNFHQKRYCSNCDYLEIADVAKKGNCPKCGDESWSAASNVHTYAKLISVKSFNNQSDATLTDSKDERENIVYNTLRHFNFKNAASSGAWAMKEIPFGIEFVRNVTITDSNLGRTDGINARKIKINELEIPAHGFITCKYCGKSSAHINQKNYKQHYGYCKHKEVDYNGAADDVFEEVFFFREVKTEALKILLPVQEFNSDAEIKMFKAGIELGLKKYFKGNPQHIIISEYREYNESTQKFDKYLVLYDSIPGGTGYLEKLFDWKEFNQLLKIAYQEIKNCGCQHKGKDGCYRCIYSYSNQYYQDELSREKAEKRFEKIIKQSEGWESNVTGLGSITNNGYIEESELEERFIRSLRILGKKEANWEFKEVNQDGIISYTLTYQSASDSNFAYHIRPQVDLGPNEGIAYHTRTDFLITCTYAENNGIILDDLLQIPKIAVYLDGFQYHASKENNRFVNDFEKRNAINASPAYKTWSLTWEDIEKFDQHFLPLNEQNNKTDYLEELFINKGFKETKSKLLKVVKNDTIKLSEAKNNVERLLKYLSHPQLDTTFYKGWSLYAGLFQKSFLKPSFNPEHIVKALDDSSYEQYCIDNKSLNGLVRFGGIPNNSLFKMNAIINLQKGSIESVLKFLNTETIDKTEWNQFWILYNIFQFFKLTWNKTDVSTNEDLELVEYTLEDLLNYFDNNYHSILTDMYQNGLVKSEADEQKLYSLTDNTGKLIAEAYLIIEAEKIVYEPSSEEDRYVFEKNGYTIKSKKSLNKN